jgi:hypothetical protein
VSSRALGVLSDGLRAHRNQRQSRWRKLSPGRQALLVLAHLRKARPMPTWPADSRSAPPRSTRYIREALDLLAAMTPTLAQAIEVASRKAFVMLDGTLLRIDRVGMASGYDRAFYSGKHKAHGLNVQVITDPIGRLVWISPPLLGARHDMGAAREHGIIAGGHRRSGAPCGEHPAPDSRGRAGRKGAAAVRRSGRCARLTDHHVRGLACDAPMRLLFDAALDARVMTRNEARGRLAGRAQQHPTGS